MPKRRRTDGLEGEVRVFVDHVRRACMYAFHERTAPLCSLTVNRHQTNSVVFLHEDRGC